jgi:hypothetical protein
MKKILHILTLTGVFTALTVPLTAQLQFGKSYVNITRPAGGTIQAGDELEIRATIAVGDWSGTITVSQLRFNDTVPANTTYVNGSLKLLTTEGYTFRTFTDAVNDDAGVYNSGNKTLRINVSSFNVSTNATTVGNATSTGTGNASSGGTVNSNDKPSFYGGICIVSASYRITVNSPLAFGTNIPLSNGAFRYQYSSANYTQILNKYTITLFQNLGLCTSPVTANAVIDNNGNFGSGTTQNRGTSSGVVTGYTFTNVSSVSGSEGPLDGSYSIVNNSSGDGNTNNGLPYPETTDPHSRIFTVWDIIGDHTGAASPSAGNNPVAPGTNGGYMVLVNASYGAGAAIQQTISGLCANTYYEFSAWFRNVCGYCATDTLGNGGTSGSFTYAASQKPGVLPNLTYEINGKDYYSTGNLPYNQQWVKKGFVYKTGPLETSFNIVIRNNAAGGGGNDWVMDDVTLARCPPNIVYNFNPNYYICDSNVVSDLWCSVTSNFNTDTAFIWERSTDNGATWNTSPGTSAGTTVPTYNAGTGLYTYYLNHPSFIAYPSMNGYLYRIKIASTVGNLSLSNCYVATSQTIRLNVNSCLGILPVRLISFSGINTSSGNQLQWSAENQADIMSYEIERSSSGNSFMPVGTKNGSRTANAAYQFTDVQPFTGDKTFYRLKMTDAQGRTQYSKIIIILSSRKVAFEITGLQNPVQGALQFNCMVPATGKVDIGIHSAGGAQVYTKQLFCNKGLQHIYISETASLSPGIYALTVRYQGMVINKKIVKQ